MAEVLRITSFTTQKIANTFSIDQKNIPPPYQKKKDKFNQSPVDGNSEIGTRVWVEAG